MRAGADGSTRPRNKTSCLASGICRRATRHQHDAPQQSASASDTSASALDTAYNRRRAELAARVRALEVDGEHSEAMWTTMNRRRRNVTPSFLYIERLMGIHYTLLFTPYKLPANTTRLECSRSRSQAAKQAPLLTPARECPSSAGRSAQARCTLTLHPRPPAYLAVLITGVLTISLPLLGATVTDATLEPEGRLRMALYDHMGTTYALDLQLAALVNVTSDWWRVLPREVLLTVQKRGAGPYWRHLLRDGQRPPKMRIDWARWLDEARDGVRWNELADRRWDWWKPEKETAVDDDEL